MKPKYPPLPWLRTRVSRHDKPPGNSRKRICMYCGQEITGPYRFVSWRDINFCVDDKCKIHIEPAFYTLEEPTPAMLQQVTEQLAQIGTNRKN